MKLGSKLFSFLLGTFFCFPLFFVEPTQAVGATEGSAFLEVKTPAENPGAQVFTHNRNPTARVVAAAAAIPEAGEAELVAQLKQARLEGDAEASAALVAQLDALHGVFSVPATASADSTQQVFFGQLESAPGLRWMDGDILVTNPAFGQAKPSIASAPNGDLYVAVERTDASPIHVYKSVNNGETWSLFVTFQDGADARNPSVTYAESSTEQWVYVAYESENADGTRSVRVFRIAPDASVFDFATVQSGIVMAGAGDHIYPRITSDNLVYGELYYLYLTYALFGIDYYPVYFTRSADRGLSWTSPVNVTGGAENSLWQTRPDIAYGANDSVFISFEKLGLSVTGAAPSSREPLAETVFANAGASVGNVEVSEPVTPTVFDGDLRDLPRAPDVQPGAPEIEIPRLTHGRSDAGSALPPANPPAGGPDPLLALQDQASTAMISRAFSTPDLNFSGQTYTGVVPPDPVGEVGLNYYIQMTNHPSGSIFTIYSKATGTVASGPTVLSTLASTGNCTSGHGDPIVLFDTMANRWMMSEFSNTGNTLCVYVSQTSNPITGGWYAYAFATPNFPDYPKYSVWPDAYYVTTNEAGGPAAYALDRTSMLSGSPATSQRFTATSLAGFGFQALTPGDLDGSNLPPSGTPGYFIRHRDDEAHNVGSNNPSEDYLEIWEFDVDWATPGNSTFTKAQDIAISEFDSDLCGYFSFNCFPQLGTAVTLDPLREVVMWRLQYRNSGTHETLVGNMVTDVNGNDQGGIRWFELRKSGASWTVYQEGTHAPDSNSRWLGSIAMDGVGNMALGYSVSSPSMYPGIRYTGRQSSDPLGTMVGEYTIINGGGYSSSNRWGDYSSMNVDPVDDCTFWYTMEYPNANNNWDTQIASFAFDSCTNPVSWDNQIFVTQSTDYGTSWNAPTQITNNTDEQYHPRIAAAIGNDSVVVAYTRDWVSTGDTDVMYYYSTDGGATWNGENSLPWSLNNEESVDLAASNDLGNFHAVYWANYDIWHTSAPVATPNVWSSPATVVNELNFASLGYPRPTVTVNPIAPLDAEAAVAWTDFRNPNHAIYFDSAGLGQPDKIGVYRPSGKRFYLDVDGNFLWNPPPDLSVPFGAVGDTPITGDWNGDGVDEIGVYRSSIRLFYLDVDGDYVWNPAIDVTAPFGAVGDTPIIGDWNGDGVDEIGVYRSSIRRFYLDLDGSLSWDPALDLTTAFGGVGDTPIAGDWSGDGRDQIGVHRASIKRFYMDTDGDYVWNPALDTTVAFGAVGDTSIIGDWNGDGVDEIGVYRPPVKLFFMDTNGDFVWNPAVDVSAAFGAVGDEPIIGNW